MIIWLLFNDCFIILQFKLQLFHDYLTVILRLFDYSAGQVTIIRRLFDDMVIRDFIDDLY